jgi:spoIIIJ-associated protein
MTQEKTTLEIIAPSVDDAVAKGLSQLGLPSDAVEVEVLDAGSRGLFGLGGRHARIRLSIKSVEPAAAKVEEPAVPTRREARPAKETQEPEIPPVAAARPAPELDDKTLNTAASVVRDLLEKMHVKATVTAEYGEPQEPEGAAVVIVEVQGDDLSILIGRKSETLNALQYITSLILGKELGQWVPLMIDVQGYRVRRERSLRQLAHKMADQAIQSGKRQTLEPMPAAERRIIHLELRNHPQVFTESIGDEPNRKVTILLKK